jgi:hypothetical protein
MGWKPGLVGCVACNTFGVISTPVYESTISRTCTNCDGNGWVSPPLTSWRPFELCKENLEKAPTPGIPGNTCDCGWDAGPYWCSNCGAT